MAPSAGVLRPAGRLSARVLSLLLVAALFAVAACQEASPSTSVPDTGNATPSAPSAPPSTGEPAATLTAHAAEACEAGDEAIVSADVADLGGHMVATADGLWMARFGSPEVIHVEGSTMCPDATVTVEGADLGVASMTVGDDGLVYVAAAQTGAVSVIDPETGAVSPSAEGAAGGGGLAVAAGRLWAVCCGTGAATRPSGIFDLASGEMLAELDIGPGMGIEVTGDNGWIGRTDATGLYEVALGTEGAEVAESAGFGATTVAVAAGESGVYLVGDEPVLQRWADGEVEEVAVLPLPRERPVDIDVADDGSVFVVSPFGPGVIWVRADGTAFNLGGAQSLIQVEAVGEWVWTLDTGGILTRISRSALGG